MRNAFRDALIPHARRDDYVFLTGDLGFMALEPLRDARPDRFINTGVAEQNMVSMAAGMAKTGLRPFAYSIAPFIYARPYEQIRNDVCLHRLGVTLVGNGGGYGYGAMGATHHALEDYGVLSALPHMTIYVPAFAGDVAGAVEEILANPGPSYLRLGRCEKPKEYQALPFTAWRKLCEGRGPVILVIGPLAGCFLAEALGLPEATRPNLWVLAELPITKENISGQFIAEVQSNGTLAVVEEHVAAGGAGCAIASALLELGHAPHHFSHHYARGYPSGFYGSQVFHRKESGIDPATVFAELGIKKEAR